MEANELRIGNWVQLEIMKPYQIEPHHFLLNEDGYSDCLDLSIPIPLTEDWLIKFGFKKKKEAFHIDLDAGWSYLCLASDFSLCIYGSPHHYENGFYPCFQRDVIKYVHQLQNIYFALTGQELECS